MTTVKRFADLTSYAGVLPFASELFGVYQPLLGWKSKRTEQRLKDAYKNDKRQIMDKLRRKFGGVVDITYTERQQAAVRLKPGVLTGGRIRLFDSVVLEKIATHLPPFEELRPAVWDANITSDQLQSILQKDV